MSESLNESLLANSCIIREYERRGNSGSVTILDLPDEVLDHIFSFLTKKERIRTEWVCRRWSEFGKNYKWSWPKHLTLYVYMRPRISCDVISLLILSRCGTSLKKLRLIVNDPPSSLAFRTCHMIGAYCPNLTSITLFYAHPVMDPDFIVSITKGCTKLKNIYINVYSRGYRTIIKEDPANVCLALMECRSLEYLHLSCNTPIIEEGCLDAVGETLKGLRIRLSRMTKFAIIASKLLQRSDPIEVLGFYYLEHNLEDWPINVVRHYEHTLRELHLSYCKMSSGHWCKIPVTLKHLEVLMVPSSSLIEDHFLRILVDSCKKFRKLNISCTAVTDVGVSYLTELQELTVLNVYGTKVTGKGN